MGEQQAPDVSVVKLGDEGAKKPSLKDKIVEKKSKLAQQVRKRFRGYKAAEQTPREVLEGSFGADPRLEQSLPTDQLDVVQAQVVDPVVDQVPVPETQNPSVSETPQEPVGEQPPEESPVEESNKPVESSAETVPAEESQTPEQRYQQLVDSLTSFDVEQEFQKLKQKVDEQHNEDPQNEERQFTTKDRVRHSALAVAARAQGVKDIRGFNELVVRFERSMGKQEAKTLTFKTEPTDAEKQRIVNEWRDKGYTADIYGFHPAYDDSGSYSFNVHRQVSENVQVADVKAIKAVLESGVRSVDAFAALQKCGLKIWDRTFLDGERLNTLKTLVAVAGTDANIQFLQEYASLSRWDGLRDFAYDTGKTTRFMEFMQSGRASEYSTDFFEKARVFLNLSHDSTDISGLKSIKDLVESEDGFEFMVTALAKDVDRAETKDHKSTKLLEYAQRLAQEKKLHAVSVLLNSGLSLGSNNRLLETDTVDALLRRLDVKDMVRDPERQAFSKVLSLIDRRRCSADELNELFPNRVDIGSAYSILAKAGVISAEKQNNNLLRSDSQQVFDFVKQPEVERALKTPGIESFLAGVKKAGINFKDDNTLQDKYLLSTLKLFNSKDLLEKFGVDLSDTVQKVNSKDYALKVEGTGWLNTCMYYNENRDFLAKIEAAHPFENPREFYNINLLVDLVHSPLLKEDVLGGMSEERLQVWIKDMVKVSPYIQTMLLNGKPPEEARELLANIDISEGTRQRFMDVASLSQTEVMIRNGTLLRPLLYGYEGEIADLIVDGESTKKLSDFIIQRRAFSAYLDHNLRVHLSPLQKENIEFGLDFNTNWEVGHLVQASPEFPNLVSERLNTYKVLLEIIQFAPERKYYKEVSDTILGFDGSVADLFDGEPTKLFMDKMLATRNAKVVDAYLSEEIISKYEGAPKDALSVWKVLPFDFKEQLLAETPEFPNLPPETLERYRIAFKVVQRLKDSHSPEIKKLESQLVSMLWGTENPEVGLDEIIGVFEKNNLPLVGKVFRVFDILYPPQVLDLKLKTSQAQLSPVLQEAGSKRRYDIIYRDLLKTHIDSVNPSLYEYLHALKSGEMLIDKSQAQGFDSLDSETEVPALTKFLDKMDMLYINSLYGKRMGARAQEYTTLEGRVQALRASFNLDERESLTDKVGRMFVKPLGYESIDQVINRMDTVKKSAHERNVQYAREAEEDNGKLVISGGDVLKGVNSTFLESYFQNGLVAKEYLGGSADSDYTPFDTDTSMVIGTDLTGDYKNIVQNSLGARYGDVVLVIRNRGQFIQTAPRDAEYDPARYEMFKSNFLGERHTGIRTGIAATEIDAIFVKGDFADRPQDRDRLFFNIAQNGFYIPVMDEDGKILFTPEDYDKGRLNVGKLEEVISQDVFTPVDLINTFKESSYLTYLFEADAGVSEGYSLEQHTGMVMGQFEKYFSPTWSSPLMTRDEMRVVLSLHDLGKPLAVQVTGSTAAQHEYTMKFIPPILEQLGFDTRKAQVAAAVVDQDYLGDYIKGNWTAEKTADAIKGKASELGISTKNLMDLLRTYYMSDAGSYTEDAGGKASLDRLFIFGSDEEGTPRMQFAPDVQTKYNALLEQVYQ